MGSKWLKLIHESIESFVNIRMQYSAYKRLIRKGERGPALAAQSHHPNSDICGNRNREDSHQCIYIWNIYQMNIYIIDV